MTMQEFRARAFQYALEQGCDAAETYYAEGKDFEVNAQGGEMERYAVSRTGGLSLRVQLGGRDGYAYTECIDDPEELVRRAMDMGFYEGVNLSLAYCDDCGHEELAMDVCPVCGSKNLTKIDRMNGYLSYSRVKGDTRLNDAKMAEIAERKSM